MRGVGVPKRTRKHHCGQLHFPRRLSASTGFARVMDSNHQLHAQGLTRSEIAALVRSRQIVRLRPGAFVAPCRPESPEARHLELIEATLPYVAPDGVLSHISAAVLHDLPVPLKALHRVHLTRKAKGRITRHTHQHEGSLPVGSVTQIKGHAVTSLTRTAGDLARWLAYADAVALLDAALRRGVDRAELELERALAARRPGNMRARRALAFADPRAESPGESKSRVLLAELGLPTPVCSRRGESAYHGEPRPAQASGGRALTNCDSWRGFSAPDLAMTDRTGSRAAWPAWAAGAAVNHSAR